MPRAVAALRTVSAKRYAINNAYTKSWQANGASSYGTNAGIDYSTTNKLIVDFWFNTAIPPTGANFAIYFELSTNYNLVADSFAIFNDSATNRLSAAYRDGGGYSYWISNPNPFNNSWRHGLIVLDKSLAANVGVKTYVNGLISGSNSLASATTGGNFGNHDVYAMARAGVSNFYNGFMKDLHVRSFSGTFTDLNALEIFQGANPTGISILDEWLGEDAGTTAVDSGSKAKDLTLSNVTYSTNVPCKLRTQGNIRNAAV